MSDKDRCEREGMKCRPCGLDSKTYSHGSKVLKKMLKTVLAVQCVNGKWRGRIDSPGTITSGP